MIKIPGTPEGVPRDRAGDLRGHQRQRHAAVRRRGVRGGRRGLHPRPRAPPRRGPVARRQLGGELLRLARGHRGRQAARAARAAAISPAPPRSPTPAPRTRASRRSSSASAWERCAPPARPCSGRCGRRPGPRTPPTRTPSTSTSWSRRTPSTRCRCRRCWRSPTTATIKPGDSRASTQPRSCEALADAGIDMRRRHRRAAGRRGRAVRGGDEPAARRHRERAPAVVTGRPPTIDAEIAAELEGAVAARVKRARRARSRRRVWRRDESLWGGPGVPEIGDRLGWLTISERDARTRADELVALRRAVPCRGLHRRGAARDGRLVARARGDLADVRQTAADALRLHGARLDRPGGDRAVSRSGRPRQDAVHRLDEVGRHDRDAVAVPLLHVAGRARASSSRSPTRAARSSGSRATTASAPRS